MSNPSSVLAPYPIFSDLNGDPISGGYLYIGVANENPETNPIAVYWDSALSIPVAQPIRTIGGAPSRNGTPSSIYVSVADYSTTVKDSSGRLVSYSPSVSLRLPSSVAVGIIDSSSVNYELNSISRSLSEKLGDNINVMDFGAIGDGSLHTLQEWVTSGKFSGLSAIQIAFPKATSLSQSIDYLAIQTALDTGKGVLIPKGTYICTEEIEQITPGQHVYFENSGGYGYGEDIGLNWLPNTRIIIQGTYAKRVRTRRKFRGSSSDVQDDPLSVAWNIQAEAVFLHNPCIWLRCDYSDPSPSNLGDDCDVGIFVGCRVGVQILNPQVIGYFRKSGIHFDVTHMTTVPRHLNKAGSPYPVGVNISGADGCGISNPYIRGPRRGLVIAGALPKVGQTTYSDPYYDEQLGSTTPDTRGSFGFSDFLISAAGRIYGPDHHSNRRLKDPVLVGGLLTQAGMESEPDDAPCSMFIDGMAGNASGGVWGIRAIGTRFATFEAFRIRLGKCARIMPIACHIEGRNGGRYSTSGASIDTNDYSTISYGDISGTSATSRVLIDGSVRTSPADAYPHYYGSAISAHIDYGEIWAESYQPSKPTSDFDMRVASTSQMYLWRFGAVSGVTLTNNGMTFKDSIYAAGAAVVSEAGNLALKGKTGVYLYQDLTTVATFNTTNAIVTSGYVSITASSDDVMISCGTSNLIRHKAGATTLSTLSTTDLMTTTTACIIRPNADNTIPVCTAAKRASTIYLGSAPNVTSDANQKHDIKPIDDDALDAWGAVNSKAYKLIDGTSNRWHTGFIVQEILEAFADNGLDALDYGLCCYESWDAKPAVYEEDGETLIEAAMEAGGLWTLRYDEAYAFEAAYQRRRAERMEARLLALENRP